eukprot:COSAG05_NODE_11808_length_495_cov_0.941919_1_plen_106_part_10
MLLLLLPSLALAAVAPGPATTTLWTSGSGFPCYRQPVIVAVSNTRILAFVEGRFSSPCSPASSEAQLRRPNEVGGLNLRISDTGGTTWGASTIIYGNRSKQGPNMD